MADGNRSSSSDVSDHSGSSSSRPPLPRPGNGDNVCPVPEWEIEFCRNAYDIPWETFCENKRYIGLYRNVMRWDDSGALKNFEDAKKRFKAKYYGEPSRRHWWQKLECWRPQQSEDPGQGATPAEGRRWLSKEPGRGAAPAEARVPAAAGAPGGKEDGVASGVAQQQNS